MKQALTLSMPAALAGAVMPASAVAEGEGCKKWFSVEISSVGSPFVWISLCVV
jgi:hypothetical protein